MVLAKHRAWPRRLGPAISAPQEDAIACIRIQRIIFGKVCVSLSLFPFFFLPDPFPTQLCVVSSTAVCLLLCIVWQPEWGEGSLDTSLRCVPPQLSLLQTGTTGYIGKRHAPTSGTCGKLLSFNPLTENVTRIILPLKNFLQSVREQTQQHNKSAQELCPCFLFGRQNYSGLASDSFSRFGIA